MYRARPARLQPLALPVLSVTAPTISLYPLPYPFVPDPILTLPLVCWRSPFLVCCVLCVQGATQHPTSSSEPPRGRPAHPAHFLRVCSSSSTSDHWPTASGPLAPALGWVLHIRVGAGLVQLALSSFFCLLQRELKTVHGRARARILGQ